jgi:hypothetical protein
MQSEKKFTKYLKAQDDINQQRRALNNLIKLALGGEQKTVVDLAEALLILNLNSAPSKEALLDFFQKQRASIIAKIGNEVYEALYGWLRSGMETTTKSDFKTLQTMKSRARTLPRSPQETGSDGNSDDDRRVPQMTPRERARQAMAALETTTVKQNDENDENVCQRLESQGNKLKANHLNALIMCQVGRDEMIPMQRIAAEII